MTTQQKQENGGNEYTTRRSSAQRAASAGGLMDPEAIQGASVPLPLLRKDSLNALFDGPFALMNRLFQDMDQMFYGLLPPTAARPPARAQEWRPAVDVFEQDGMLVVQADVPGMQKENLKVEVRDDVLLISGERRSESEQRQGDYRQTERSYGKFTRSVPLPQWARPDDMSARFEDGVLKIEIPIPRRQIEIQ